MNQINGVLDRLNGLEVLAAEREAGLLLDSNRHVDGIDAVEIEIVHEMCLGAKTRGGDPKFVGQDLDHPLQNFSLGMHPGHS